MGKKLVLDILSRDKTGPGTKSAARNFDDLGDSATSAARRAEKLDREIENVENELHQLAVAFVEAQTAAERLDISKAIRRTQQDLRRINVAKSLLPTQKDTDEAGKSFARRLIGSVGGGLTSLSGTLGSSVGPTIGTAIGVAAAPTLAATLASTLSAGAGAGALGVGILAAVKGDTTIQAAGKTAAQRFMTGLESEAKVLRGPILDSLGVLSAAGDRLNKELGETFRDLSGDLTPFTRKVVGAGEAVTGSLLGAARKSGPALDGLGDAVGLLGDGVSKFIDEVADGGPQAADNIRLIAGATADMVAWTGMLIGTLNKLSEVPVLSGLLPIVRDHYAEMADKTKEASGSAKDLAGSQQQLATETEKAALAAVHQTDALSDLSKQLKAEADPVFGMLNAQDQLRDAQHGVNEAIKEHGRRSPEYQAALRKQAEAALGLEAAAGKVASTSSGKLGPALRETLRQAGFTEREINDLARQFRNAKHDGDAFAKNYKASISVSGTETSESRIKHVKKLLDGLHSKRISVGVVVADAQLNALARRLPGAFRAEGGPVRKGHAYVVGEKRPEVFVPDRDGTIIPSVDKFTRGGGSAPAAGMAAGGTLTLDVRGADTELARLFLRILKYQPAVRAEVKKLVNV